MLRIKMQAAHEESLQLLSGRLTPWEWHVLVRIEEGEASELAMSWILSCLALSVGSPSKRREQISDEPKYIIIISNLNARNESE